MADERDASSSATGRREQRAELVLGVGASMQQLERLGQLLSKLPADVAAVLVHVVDLDDMHAEELREQIRGWTTRKIVVAHEGVELQPDAVYLNPPEGNFCIDGGRVRLSKPPMHWGLCLPVDHLFRSIAREYGPRAAGILMSRVREDGWGGLREIRLAGGLAVAEQPEPGDQAEMFQSAYDFGAVDLVTQIDSMPRALQRYANLPPNARMAPAAAVEHGVDPLDPLLLDDRELGKLAGLLASAFDFDLGAYKPSTVRRRVFRRMILTGFDHLAAYLEYLRANRGEQQNLVGDLFISVTDFFRDPDAFATLRERVIEPLVAGAAAGSTLRVWVPGCATGEEAYSIGIEFLDAMQMQDKRLRLHIFATDVDQKALAVGRAGIYPPSIAERVSARRLETYFRPIDGKGYRVCSALRDTISFAVHDLTRDPPFSRIHLVSCRNVLIYLKTEIQQQVLKVLHFALQPNGHLLLGTSESTRSAGLFATVSKKHRIFHKSAVSRAHQIQHLRGLLATRDSNDRDSRSGFGQRDPRTASDGELARKALLSAWVPPTVVVGPDALVLFIHGELDSYLRIPQGDNPRLELTALLRPELAHRARGAFYKCRRNQNTVVALSSPDSHGKARIQITAKPAPELTEGAVMLTFEEIDIADDQSTVASEGERDEPALELLTKELDATREDLRNTVEELEASNEQLRSSNETSIAINEELQSANDELEATTEELRSLNEELTTVNTQLRDKVEQLEQAHNDLNNFLSSAKVATIFLDRELHVKRLTPAAVEVLAIGESDTSRFIGNFAHDLLQNGLEEDARGVLNQLSTRSRELRTADGRWFARQVLPYRTESGNVEGVVVTFIDVSDLKSTTERLAIRERQQAVIARLGLQALKESQIESFFEQTVREVQQTLDTDYCKILEMQPGKEMLVMRAGVGWREGLVGNACVSAGLDSQAGYTLQSTEPVIVEDMRHEKRFSGPPLLIEHGVISGLSCIIRYGEEYGVIGAHTTDLRAFTREDSTFLQAVASVVGSAINRYQTRIQLALESRVAKVLTEPGDLHLATTRILQCFADELGTVVGELWRPDPTDGFLGRQLLHVAPAHRNQAIAERFAGPRIEPGEDLIGKVYAKATAAWATDVGDPALFTRREPAEQLGLRSALAFPILSGREVLGVISVYSTNRLFADKVFLEGLQGIGRALGDYLSRMEIEAKAQRLAAITASSQDAILSYDFAGQITEWLGGAERLFGYSREEMIGTSIERIVPEERRVELRRVRALILRGESTEPWETKRLRKDGSSVEVSVSSTAVRDRHGNVTGIASTDRDMTRQKETEEKLLQADRQKDEFLAMLGHELRNPLAAIRSATDLLKLVGTANPQLDRAVSVLERQGAHMARLLEGLLDVSRIIRGKIRLERAIVDFAEVCREVVTDVTQRIAGRSLELRTRVPDTPVSVEGDRVRLTQIVDNLLSNAIKFTDEGGTITLALERRNDVAALSLRDTGVGIKPELLQDIFEVFSQSKQSLDRTQGGLGLGLSLVKSLVELHHGTVEASSEGVGKGAEFVVYLPITKKETKTQNGRSADRSSARHILLIEDNRDSAEMLREVLEISGHRVSLAAEGREGIEIAKQFQPDVIFCDLGLPGGFTGFDAARAIRADSQTRSIRLVALTGYGRPEDKARCSEAGFEAVLTKPVDVKAIHQLLAEFERERPS